MKTAAIVCSAAYMKGSGYGKEIDAHDVVVRLNTAYEMTAIYPEDVGRRTDACYINAHMSKNLKDYRLPEGAKIVVKKAIPGVTTIKGDGYTANTGVMALLHYAQLGYRCTVYGMSFYSEAFGGVIPEDPIGAHNAVDVDRAAVYLPEYNRERYGDTHTIAHAGGMRDFRILFGAMLIYGVKVDGHLAKIVELNRGRV